MPILVLGYVLAVVVRTQPARLDACFRTIFFLPYVDRPDDAELPPGAGGAARLAGWSTSSSSGSGITDGTTAWLVDGPLATGLICVMVVWAVSGLTMVLLMGGMQGIPRDVYESAEMDGASWWQRERASPSRCCAARSR